jgi:hypothetical protein
MGFLEMISPKQYGPDSDIWILWAGLLHEDPTLTIEKVEQMVDDWLSAEPGRTIKQIDELVTDAIIEAGLFPGADTKNPKEISKPSSQE